MNILNTIQLKKTIAAFKKDILEGNIYYDGPAGGDTHHLENILKMVFIIWNPNV